MSFQQKCVRETICSYIFLYSMKLNYQYFHESDIDFISGQSSALSIAFSGRHVIRQVIRLQGFSDITRLTDANTVYIIKIGLSRSSIK